MLRPQDFSPLEREKRLLSARSESSATNDPEPLEASTIPDFGRKEEKTSEAKNRTPRTPGNLAEQAIAAFEEEAGKTGDERIHAGILTHISEGTSRQIEAVEKSLEERKKPGILGRIANLIVMRKKTEEENLSDVFDNIASKAVDKRNESMMQSRNTALQRIAEGTKRTGSEFIFLEQKCLQLRTYINAYKAQLEVYKEERARFEQLVTTLHRGKNDVYAGEIAQIEKMIDRLEKLYAEEEERARNTPERDQVEKIKKRDDELRKLLIEENAGYFSKLNITQLILEAVGGNPKPLKDAIKEGGKDEAKRDVFLAAADELAMELPPSSLRGRAYARLAKWWKYRKDPEARKQEEERQQALAFHYSTQIIEAEKSLNVSDLDKRLEVLEKLPIGSRVAIMAPDGRAYFFTTAGRQTVGSSDKEFLILRSPDGGYAAVSQKDKRVWHQKDRYTKSKGYALKLPDDARMPMRRDPTVLYLQAA